jgi:hypothetical protein
MEIAAKSIDTFELGTPGKHEACRATDEGIEPPAALLHSIEDFSRRGDKCCRFTILE